MSNLAPHLISEAVKLESKWSRLLKGVPKDIRRHTAIMLENQELECRKVNGGRLISEVSTDTSDVAQFQRISIPLVRRIYPQLIANKIVSVQPLLGPTGLIYYLRFRYSSNKGSVQGQTNLSQFPNDDSLSMQQKASGDVNLNVYYSSQFVQNETQTNAGGGVTLTYGLQHSPVLPNTLIGSIYQNSVSTTTAIQNFTVNASGVFTFTNVGTPTTTVTAGAVNLNTGLVTMTWSADPSANKIVFSYEYNMECNQDLPEINLALENETITAKTRKLKAVWSYEAQQDIRSQHNIDMEAELTAMLAQEVNLEIDREILTDLRNNSGTVATWDFNTALGDTIKEKYEALYVEVTKLSNIIHRKTLRAGANWIVTSPEVASIFETATAGFAPAPSDTFTSSLGVQYVGTVQNRWRLYKDPQAPTTQLLMGYKGDSYSDSGYFFCPYVPLTQTPTVLDPESFCPRKGLLTRYGKILLREGAKFYARISIANYILS